MSRILVVDDEQGVCFAFEKFLKAEGHQPITCSTAEKALSLVKSERPDLVITDVRLPGMSGLDLLKRVRKEHPEISVIVITAYSTMNTAVEAMKTGAYEYLVKPIDLDEAKIHIDRALESRHLASELRMLRRELARFYGEKGKPGTKTATAAEPPVIIGKSPAMQEVFKEIGSVSMSDISVLIRGESGTGKELVARAIHTNSPRKNGPFEPITCASLSETLLESELYGHEEGAFTGAVRRKVGKFEIANGGTVFLDEIGDVPPTIQVKLLRFLEDKTFTRVGGTEHLSTNVRIIAATNRDLEARMREGAFREDLYYRLSVFNIYLPSLRERPEDVPLLAAHFLEGLPDAEMDKRTLDVLKDCRWPGNVRELRNAIEHAVVLARGKTILPEHLPGSVMREEETAGTPALDAEPRSLAVALFDKQSKDPALEGRLYEELMDVWERPLLERALELYNGNQVQVARLLGIHRTTLRKKMQKFGLL